MQSNAGGVIGGRLALLKFVGVRGECDTENYIARFFSPSVTLDPHVITTPPENSFLPHYYKGKRRRERARGGASKVHQGYPSLSGSHCASGAPRINVVLYLVVLVVW